jgi:hypothetical protein
MKVTYDAFVNTGRFVPVEVYAKEYPKVSLHTECTEVVIYTNDFIIQALKTNEFYVKKGKREIRHKTLDVVESALWYLYAEKVINNQK